MRFMSDVEATRRMAEIQIAAARVREQRRRESRHELARPHRYEERSVVR
jgi:hypothetical protein